MSNDLPSDRHKVVSKGYKYFMVFLCMLTQAIPYGIAQLIQPLFVHPSFADSCTSLRKCFFLLQTCSISYKMGF